MHLMAREDTGLRCLLRVALEGRSGAPVSIALIADKERISGVYAAKLMRQLRIAGLVDSKRGAAGGYRLTRDASEITVWDAIQALDESFLPATTCDCLPEDRVDCRRTTDCAVSSLWRRIGDEIRRQLSAITLADLCAGSSASGEHVSLPIFREIAACAPTHQENEGTSTWRFSN
jgi:Rrf2 family protein